MILTTLTTVRQESDSIMPEPGSGAEWKDEAMKAKAKKKAAAKKPAKKAAAKKPAAKKKKAVAKKKK